MDRTAVSQLQPKAAGSFDEHMLKGDPAKRFWNVVAVLQGTTLPDRHVMVSGHYDTIDMIYKQTADGKRQLDSEATVAAPRPA